MPSGEGDFACCFCRTRFKTQRALSAHGGNAWRWMRERNFPRDRRPPWCPDLRETGERRIAELKQAVARVKAKTMLERGW